MAFVLIQLHGQTRAGTLGGRVLIGRWPINTIVVDDTAVSRVHAWIGIKKAAYYIADTGSRTGTYVNGVLLQDRRALHDGAEIMIGPLRLTYHADGLAPADIEPIDLSPRSAQELTNDRGIFADCPCCGAPLWIPLTQQRATRCRYCAESIPAPTAGAILSKPKAAPLLPPLPGMNQSPVKADVREESSMLVAPRVRRRATPEMSPARELISPPRVQPPSKASEPAPDLAPLADLAPRLPDPPPSLPEPAPTAETVVTPAPLLDDAVAEAPSFTPEVQDPALTALTPALASSPAPLAPPRELVTPALRPPLPKQMCGVCHTAIYADDVVHECPSCRLKFHDECWIENRGCSAFGCQQVGALERLSPSQA